MSSNKWIMEINDPEQLKIIFLKEVLTFKEALFYLGISKSLLYKLTSKKKIVFTKPNNGKLYFKKKDLENWLNQNRSIDTSSKQLVINTKINE